MKYLHRFELPLKIDIAARDNPEGDVSSSNFGFTHLLLNIIRPQDGVVLVIANTPPAEIEKQKDKLAKLLRSQTGLLVEIDRLEISETKYVIVVSCWTLNIYCDLRLYILKNTYYIKEYIILHLICVDTKVAYRIPPS